MLVELEPPIRDSVLLVDGNKWSLGSRMMCERLDPQMVPTADALCSWSDLESFFILRRQTGQDTERLSTGSQPTASGRVHDAGSMSAVWIIGGDVICKVRSWLPGMTLEADTIAFVQRTAPTIPTPEVIYSWVDESLSRTFLLMKRAAGMSLVDAWPRLSSIQCDSVAKQITEYCVELALQTSLNLESATGQAVPEYHFTEDQDFHSVPSWKPSLLGPLHHSQYTQYLQQLAPHSRMLPTEPPFCFTHNDLAPTNIFVEITTHQEVRVTGLIDWECAGYFPRFIIATRPRISFGHILGEDESWCYGDRAAWSKLLHKSLETAGFKSDVDGYITWNAGKQ